MMMRWLALFVLTATVSLADDWPWWRGPNLDAIALGKKAPPLKWSATENILWKADVPGRGHGSPILYGNRVILATADDEAETQSLLCFDRNTGRPLWKTEIHRGGLIHRHKKNSHASSTPACDGELVFIPFAVQEALWLTALNLDGKIVWQKRLGAFKSMHGYGASPVLYGSMVIVAGDSVEGSFLIALQRRTGEVAWRIGRDNYDKGNYASPMVGRVAGRDQLLIPGPFKTYSYDPSTGNPLWTCDGPSSAANTTIIFDRERIYSSGGFPQRNLLCIRADGTNDVTATHRVWSKPGNATYIPSLLLHDGLLYMAHDNGKFTCFNADDGAEIWSQKLEGGFSSSPVLANGHIYVVNEDGVMFVLKEGRQFELVAKNNLGDGGFATPSICDGRIYLRTLHALYCIGQR